MTRPRNPIDIMTDRACGVPEERFEPDLFGRSDPVEPLRDPVRLVCTSCGDSIVVERDGEPPIPGDGDVVETICPGCTPCP